MARMPAQLISATPGEFTDRNGRKVEWVDLIVKIGDLGVVNATCKPETYAGLNGTRERLAKDEIVSCQVDVRLQVDRNNAKRYAVKLDHIEEPAKSASRS